MADETQRQLAAEARKVLKVAQDRGVEEGEKLGYEKGVKSASRQAMLEMHAAGLEAAAEIAEDETSETAFKEAAGILRDLADRGSDGIGRRVERRTVSSNRG